MTHVGTGWRPKRAAPSLDIPANGWHPRDYQLPLWDYMENGGKRAVAVWHRRSGKDEVALHWTATAAMQRVGTYWHLLPQANQARRAIWEANNPHTGLRRIDECFPRTIRARESANEMMIRFTNGSSWQVVGSDSYDALVGAPPIGIVFSEWALSDPRAWGFMRPILLENNGWALFITTPRGRNHLASTLANARAESAWFNEILTAEQTGVFTPEQLAAERREMHREHGAHIGEALYRQEYLCDLDAPTIGAYYGSEMAACDRDGRIDTVPPDFAHPIVTAWDIGYGDATAIWTAQKVGLTYRILDYMDGSGVGAAFYVERLKARGWPLSSTILPHDAGNGSPLTGGSFADILRALGMPGITVLPRTDNVDAEINTVRMFLPQCYFDAKRCERGIDALRVYRARWDDKGHVLRPTPVHDWASDPADAFRTLAIGMKHSIPSASWSRQLPSRKLGVVA